ncbi:hypothetical protein LCGC14_0289230 [marine sediment metagenome]|uniref:Cohesin domain-containing protein n=1 Tax=marine sediment metagenome TaxID=412755 RepID=A0A0F9WF05_9ZZZZ
MSFEPQTAVRFCTIPIDAALEQGPTVTEATLLACPTGENMQLELLAVGFRANTLPIDGSNDVDVDLEFIDDSDSDSVTDFITDYDLTGGTVLVYNSIWRGSKILDAGDAINAEFTVTTPDTASEGAALIVEYRVLRRS